MTILVTGGTGQVGQALASADGELVHCVARPEFDFDRPETIAACFAAAAPSLVVNAAAYTAVDAAESDAAAAYRANRDGPAQLAALCAGAGIPLIHLSTDYVFDGAAGPYAEDAPTGPQSVYGASKLAGEREVLVRCPDCIILRTSWIYAAAGKNFVRTMLNAGRKTARLRVVADQRGSPTSAADLAAAILAIAKQIRGGTGGRAGIYHATGSGWTTWHGFATAIFAEAARYGWPVPVIEPVATADWPTAAKRPADSRLNCGKLERVFGLKLPEWRESLATTMAAIFL